MLPRQPGLQRRHLLQFVRKSGTTGFRKTHFSLILHLRVTLGFSTYIVEPEIQLRVATENMKMRPKLKELIFNWKYFIKISAGSPEVDRHNLNVSKHLNSLAIHCCLTLLWTMVGFYKV